MASSWSSSSPMRSGPTRDEDKMVSPIPYREGPLEYDPAVNCYCGVKSARWTSWSNANPGRRYHKCYRARSNGCNFWQWYDDKPTEFQRQILVDLRDTVNKLKMENNGVRKRQEDDLLKKMHDREEEIERKKREIDNTSCIMNKLERENSQFKLVVYMLIVLVVIVFFFK